MEPPRCPGRAPLGQPQGRAVVHPRRYLDGERLFLHAPALAPALGARVRDGLAGAGAARAGHAGDDLAQQRLADPPDLAGPLAVRADHRLGARRGAPAGAGGAGGGQPDRDLLAAAEDGLGELQADPHLGVGPGRRPATAAAPARHLAEERLENVTQASLEAEAARAGLASEDALGAEAVVASPLLGVAEDLVGHRDLLELGLGRGVTRIGVGMELTGTGPVGLLDLVVAGLGPDSQEPVEVA